MRWGKKRKDFQVSTVTSGVVTVYWREWQRKEWFWGMTNQEFGFEPKFELFIR